MKNALCYFLFVIICFCSIYKNQGLRLSLRAWILSADIVIYNSHKYFNVPLLLPENMIISILAWPNPLD